MRRSDPRHYTWGVKIRSIDKVLMYNMTREEAEAVAGQVEGLSAVPIDKKRCSPNRRQHEEGHGIQI